MAVLATSWSCARCAVSASRMDGGSAELPDNWSGSGQKVFCLVCRRALAGEASIESAPADSSRQELALIRRTALIEFEIRRAPEAPNQMIARACRTSPAAVAAIRDS
jgi:hypothetical protein